MQKAAGYGTLQSQQSMQSCDEKLQTAATDCSGFIVSVSDRQWGTESVTALFFTHARIFQNLSDLVLFINALQLIHLAYFVHLGWLVHNHVGDFTADVGSLSSTTE